MSVVALLVAAAIASPSPSPSPTTATATSAVRDEIGRAVTIPAHPARIVSLAPAITETLFAVGAGAQVVGDTRYCDYPAEAKAVTKVGGFADPDVERIVALKPDLVIATADTTSRDRFDALARLGVTLFAIDPRDLAGVAASIRHVGAIAGHADDGERVARGLEAARDDVAHRVAGKEKVKAILLFSADPPIAAGPNTFVDEMLRDAGGVNVAGNAATSYPRFGIEGLIALDPAIVFTTVDGSVAPLTKMLAGSRAARGDAIVELDASLVERPGPRLADGLREIAARLHPEAFPGAAK